MNVIMDAGRRIIALIPFISALCLAALSACSQIPERPKKDLDTRVVDDPPPLWSPHEAIEKRRPDDEKGELLDEYLRQIEKPRSASEEGGGHRTEQPAAGERPLALQEQGDTQPVAHVASYPKEVADLAGVHADDEVPKTSPLDDAILEWRMKHQQNPEDLSLVRDLAHLLIAKESFEDADRLLQQLNDDDVHSLVLKFIVARWIGDELQAANLLDQAMSKVREKMPLEITDAALCTVIRGFGDYDAFPSYSFTPGSKVALYIQCVNFPCVRHEATGRYRIALHVGLEILTQSGDRIPWPSWEPQRGHYEKHSLCSVRDLFLSVLLKLPDTMTVGEYILRITVKDPSSTKEAAQKDIRFSIR